MEFLTKLTRIVLGKRHDSGRAVEPLVSDFVASAESVAVRKPSAVVQPTRDDGCLSDSAWCTDKESDDEATAIPKRKHEVRRRASSSSPPSSESENEIIKRRRKSSSSPPSSESKNENNNRNGILSSFPSSSEFKNENNNRKSILSSLPSSSKFENEIIMRRRESLSSPPSFESENEIIKRRRKSSSSPPSSESKNENNNKKRILSSSSPSAETENDNNERRPSSRTGKGKNTPKEQRNEIYNKTAFQSMFPKSNFAEHLLLAQTVDNTLLTDIGDIIYAQGHPRMRLAELTEAFSDNVMLVTFRDAKTHLDESKTRVRVKIDTVRAINAKVTSILSTKLTGLKGNVVKIKSPYKLTSSDLKDECNDNNRPNKYRRKQVETAFSKEFLLQMKNKYPDTIVIPIKVSLADVSLHTSVEALSSVVNLLRADDYFVMDIDVTQDNKGIFNKSELREYLIREHGFRMENDTAKTEDVTAWYNRSWNPELKSANVQTEKTEEEKVFNPSDYFKNPDNYEIPRPIILDDDDTKGLDCLTWIYLNTRVKVYNKFICEITSPGVSKTLGNHIADLITPSTTRLAYTFKCGVSTGVTRLELTIYYPTVEVDSAEDLYKDCMGMIDLNKSYIANAPFYTVPFSAMWSRLCSELKNSCTVIVDDEILVHAYWANSRTRKITGTCWQLNGKNKKKLANYAITGLSFDDLPAYLLRVTAVPELDLDARRLTENLPSDQSYVYIDQSCFFKNKSGARTFFTRSDTPYTTVELSSNNIPLNNISGENLLCEFPDAEHVDFYKAGLVDTPHVKPSVHRKPINEDSNLAFCGYLRVEQFPKLIFKPRPLWVSEYKRNGKSYGKGKGNDTAENLLGPTEEEIRDLRNNLQSEYEERMSDPEQKRLMTNKVMKAQEINILKQFNSTRYKNLNPRAYYKVYAFIVQQKQISNYPKVGVLASEQLIDSPVVSPRRVFYFKGYLRPKFVDIARFRYKERGYSRVFQIKTNYPIVFMLGEDPIVTFETNGGGLKNGYEYANVKNHNWNNAIPSTSCAPPTLISIPDNELKPKLCTNMDDLKPGAYTVVAMSPMKCRQKRKFVIKLEVRGCVKDDTLIRDQLYMSNFWFEQEFQRMCSLPSPEQKARAVGVFTRVDSRKVFDIYVGDFKRDPGKKNSRIVVIAGHKISIT